MGIKFVVKETPEPPGPEWVSVFDNTYWENGGNATWTGTQWNASGPGMTILVKSGSDWWFNFRPTQIRITGTVGFSDTVSLRDTLNATIATASTASPLTMSITFTIANIERIQLYGYNNVTNIEFLGGTLWT